MQSLRMSRCFPQSWGSTICQWIFVILSTESLMLYFLVVYKPCLFDNLQIFTYFLQSRPISFFCLLFKRFCFHPWCALYRFSCKGVCTLVTRILFRRLDKNTCVNLKLLTYNYAAGEYKCLRKQFLKLVINNCAVNLCCQYLWTCNVNICAENLQLFLNGC